MNLPEVSNEEEEGSNDNNNNDQIYTKKLSTTGVTMMKTNCEETYGDGEDLTDAISFLTNHLDTKTVWQKTKYIWNDWTCKDYNLEVKGRKEIGEVIFKLVLWLLSVSDIVSDALLVREYLQNYHDKTYGEESWRSWRFSILTFAFIYMPSLNVITTTCGPSRAGKLGLIFGILMGIAGGLLAAFGLSAEETGSVDDILTPETWALVWLFLILGSSMILLGVSLQNSHNRPPQGNIPLKIIDLILFPILVSLSPIIFVFIKLLGVLKPKSQLLKHQSTVGSRAEALLESGPQLGVQLYVVLFRMSSTRKQSFSIFTSALSISISSIEHFVTARSEEFGPMSILKNICLFLPATFFKILSVSIIFLLFDLYSLAIIGFFCLLFFIWDYFD